MSEKNDYVYVELEQGDRFRVISEAGITYIVCRGEDNARQYAMLMNKAYAAGYKSGFRDGKRGICRG